MDEQQKRRVSPLTLFYSYAHEDEWLCNELGKHLSLLHRQGLISAWHDRQILPGDEWAHDIDAHLETASIVLLLISPDFLASDYCYDTEMKHALERHQRGEARVIPIILRPCDWQSSPFAHLQCLPHDGKAVTIWQNPDEAFLAITQDLRRFIERQQVPARPLARMEQQNRTRLMKRMRATWIEGVLEHSLHQAALIALDLQEQPDALANPWQLEVQETNLPSHPLPAGTPIVQVYDEAEGELLILGEPGAGKTTLLLHLASDLLKRAEQESAFPMPVLFMLSSWAEKRLSLANWLIEELFTKYQVPRNLGRSWVEHDQLLLLLDGLDEVSQVYHGACIQAINGYRQEHNLVPVVLCSRKAEYEAQSMRASLSKAVVIQPLTSQQIDDYLTQAGPQLEAVHSLLHEDQGLQELVRTPLMLTILALTYQGKAVDDLVRHMPPDVQRHHVLGTYVERMLQRRAVSPYTPDQTRHWLTWLARQMQQQGQSIFYLEQMQPNWLEKKQLRRIYQNVSVKLSSGLISWLVGILVFAMLGGRSGPWLMINGLVSGFIGVLISGRKIVISSEERTDWPWKRTEHSFINAQHVRAGVLVGVASGTLFGLIGGLLYLLEGGSLLYGLFGTIFYYALFGTIFSCILFGSLIGGLIGVFVFGFTLQNFQHMKFGLLGGLIGGPIGGLYAGLEYGLESGLFSGLHSGLLFMLIGIFLSVFLEGRTLKIQPTEILNASLGNLGRSLFNKNHLRNGLIVGLLVWLIFGIASLLLDESWYLTKGSSPIYLLSNGLLSFLSDNLGESLPVGLIIGLLYWLFVGLFSGLTRNNLNDYQRISPNQGIWYSMRNSVVVGFIGCFIIVLCFLLAIVLRNLLGNGINSIIGLFIDSIRDQELQEVRLGLSFAFSNDMVILGLTGWSLCVLLSGGLPFIEHFTLRFFLWCTKSIPWSYPRFLGYATERILLCKVGGGYIFIHRLLLDYFASLKTSSSEGSSTVSASLQKLGEKE